MFIGDGPVGCSKEINDVFGEVNVVGPEDVEIMLEKIQAEIEIAKKCDEELGEIKNRVQQLNLENVQAASILEKCEEKVNHLTKDIEEAAVKTQQIQREVQSLKRKLEEAKEISVLEVKQKLDEADKQSKELEDMQDSFLTDTSAILAKIKVQKFILEKKKEKQTKKKRRLRIPLAI